MLPDGAVLCFTALNSRFHLIMGGDITELDELADNNIALIMQQVPAHLVHFAGNLNILGFKLPRVEESQDLRLLGDHILDVFTDHFGQRSQFEQTLSRLVEINDPIPVVHHQNAVGHAFENHPPGNGNDAKDTVAKYADSQERHG